MRLIEASQEVVNAFNSGKYDEAFKLANTTELEEVMTMWIEKNLNNMKFNDSELSKIVQLLLEWYVAYNSVDPNKNPLFFYLTYLNQKQITPKYDELILVNNKYARNELTRDDLKLDNESKSGESLVCPVLSNKNFYNQSNNDQDYWIDICEFFSDEREVKDILSNLKDSGKVIQIEGEEQVQDANYYMNHIKDFRDLILFINGDRNGSLRATSSIEKLTKDLADNQKSGSEKNAKLDKASKKTINQFIKDNKQAFENKDFVKILRQYLNSLGEI